MNSTITLVDAQGIKKPTVIAYEGLLSDWIMENLDNSVPASIYSGGLRPEFLIATSDSDIDEDEFLRLNMHHEKVYIVSNPLGIDPYTILIRVVIAVAVSLITTALMPTPNLPEGTRQGRSSPNNNVGPQTNVSRPNDRVPDVFGEDRCVPDLITPGVFEFKDHVKFIEQDFCISRGYGLIEDVRSGETKGDDIVGFELDVYEPGQSPDRLLKGRESNEVKALTLNSPNDSGVLLDGDDYVTYDAVGDIGTVNSSEQIWDDISTGASVSLSDVFFSQTQDLNGSYITGSKFSFSFDTTGKGFIGNGSTLTIDGNFSSLSGRDYTFVNIISNGDVVADGFYEIVSANSSELVVVYSSVTSGSVDSGFVRIYSIDLLSSSSENSNWTSVTSNQILTSAGGQVRAPRVSKPDEVQKRGPFIVPGDNNEEIWVDIQFTKGLVYDFDRPASVNIKFTVEEVDQSDIPTGYSFVVSRAFTDATQDPRFYTVKINQDNYPSFIPYRRYRITAERTTRSLPDNIYLIDEAKWTRLEGIENITQPDTTGTTRIKVKTQATEQTSSLQQSQINLKWTRKCAYWDGSNVIGDLSTGVGLIPSRRMADNFLTYAIDPILGARNPSNLDLETIYEIQDELDGVFNGEKGEFGFTFSDPNTPALEEMRQIANSCRCFIYRLGSVITMVRDESQPLPGALFNRRNKIPFKERKSQRTNKPLDYDGIELTYKSRTDDEPKTIILPDDLPASDPNYGSPPAKNLKVLNPTGIRNLSQAWDRAQYEYNKIIYQRESVETTVDEEGILLSLNERIEHADGTRIYDSRSDGEVLGFNGLIVDTSEMCFFEDGKTYSVIFRNEDGALTNAIPVTKRDDTAFGFILQSQQNIYTRGFNDYQLGSLYEFSSDDDNAKSYLVQSITPNELGEITLELINYDERYYQADNQIPPEGIE